MKVKCKGGPLDGEEMSLSGKTVCFPWMHPMCTLLVFIDEEEPLEVLPGFQLGLAQATYQIDEESASANWIPRRPNPQIWNNLLADNEKADYYNSVLNGLNKMCETLATLCGFEPCETMDWT